MKHEGFTPGPWFVVRHDRRIEELDDRGRCVAIAATGVSIAFMDYMESAPDLLAENERLRALLVRVDSAHLVSGADSYPEIRDLFREIRAALAASKGGSK